MFDAHFLGSSTPFWNPKPGTRPPGADPARRTAFAQAILLVCATLVGPPVAAGASVPAAGVPLWNSQESVHPSFAAFGRVPPPSAERDDMTGEASWSERRNDVLPTARWTELTHELIVKYQQNPLRAARVLALVHTAMHDALVLAAGRKLEPPGRIAAMHRAASLVLNHMYPQEPLGRLEGLGAAAAVAAARSRAERTDHAELALRSGEEAAALAISRSMRDGAGRQWPVRLRPKDAPGRWRATPPLNVYNPAEAFAGTWRPWVLQNGAEFQAPPPPAFGSPEYRKDVEEVLQVAQALTAEQKAIADRWHLGQGTVTPAGVWNMIALDMVRAGGISMERSVEMFAALNVAMMDAFIACWHVKYEWWTERPVTAIRERLDPVFLPHLVTPAFPSYVSGHATVSGAAETILADYFPDDATRLRQQSEEAAMSRLYGGIHFRSDNDEGLKLGRRVGGRVLARLKERAPGQRD
jgi:hypothetical protein